MLRPKNKFYEMSQREKEGEKINDIYKLISQQEQTMAQLLSKYQGPHSREYSYQQQSRTIETHSFRESTPNKKERASTKIEHITLQLPNISPNRASNKKKKPLKKSKDKLSDLNPYFEDLKSEKDKIQLKNHLQKAYGTERLKINRSKSKIESNDRQGQHLKKFSSERVPNAKQETSEKEKQVLESVLPTPLGYLRDNVEEDSSSSEGEVPLNYYQRQFRTTIRSQCLEQTNFLYFSKNQSMKDWTEGLLLLFQKHDKQLQSLRKKCKYLEKFDDNFFSIDIFKEG